MQLTPADRAAKLRQIEADNMAAQQSIRAETALAQFPADGSAKRPFDRAHVSSCCTNHCVDDTNSELAHQLQGRTKGGATMGLRCSQVLPCIVGSSAPLSELVQQVVAAFKSADTGDVLDELTVRTAILDMAARKAHAGPYWYGPCLPMSILSSTCRPHRRREQCWG